MNYQGDPHDYMINNILNDDKEPTSKQPRFHRKDSNYSAPPSLSLYNYEDLQREILGEDIDEVQDVCTKLEPPSPKKLPKRHKYSFDSFDELSLSPLTKSQSTQPEKSPKVENAECVETTEKVEVDERQESTYQFYGYSHSMQYVHYMQPYYPYQQIHYLIMQALQFTQDMAKERNHSKTLQYYFENASPEDRDLIFQEVVKDAFTLSSDAFGNYVVQKILEVGSKYHKEKLFEILKGRISDLSLNSFGCRVVQRIIESLATNYKGQQELVQQLLPIVNNLIVDQNANHVVQKMFEYFHVQNTNCIAETLFNDVETYAFHIYGCRVLQKYIERGNGSPFFKKTLEKINEMMIPLCKCLYGNYVMQYLVVNGPLESRNVILSTIKNNFISLSLDKFASNVAEKSIIHCNDNYRKEILKILQAPHESYKSEIGLVILAKGQYSNYVIQRYLECSTRQIQESIMGLIKEGSENYERIKDSSYGRHVLGQLEKYR